MMRKITDPAVASRLELIVRRLDSLSTLPCVAIRFLSQLQQTPFSSSGLVGIVESDPVLTAKMVSVMHQQGLGFSDKKPPVRWALDKLPTHIIRDALFSVKVLQPFDRAGDNGRTLLRKQLILHSLAVACCAKEIAELMSPQIDSNFAYVAGLLHDIGKFAFEEAMPKSFARMVEQAETQESSLWVIEQEHLGFDHTTLGKRLAQKWHVPSQVILAVWLHHNDTVTIAEGMPEAKIAQVVQLADLVARRSRIGQSGSYDLLDSAEQIAHPLAIRQEQLEHICQRLPEIVEQRSRVLGLDLPNAAATYCDTIQSAFAQLAQDNSKLTLESRRLQTASSHFDFMTEFLLSIKSSSLPIDIAENFAARWQKFYQTGLVCLYLIPPAGSQMLEAAVVETIRRSRVVYLNAPAASPLIPGALADKFSVLDAEDGLDWLFEQLDVEFDLAQTKLVPLISNGRAVGTIVFELRYPSDAELFRKNFNVAASVAASVLNMAVASADQQCFAEQFAQLLANLKPAPRQAIVEVPPNEIQRDAGAGDSFIALAEMAGGAAHELNNPLSVISGRAQLLTGAETDPEKKRMLIQIQENAREISAILNDLMTFAKPPSPRAAETDIRRMLDEAIQLTSQKTSVEHINVQIQVADGLNNIFVDSAQIVSAIANIICNSLESYTDKMGPVRITADADSSGDSVRLQISDLGCGMDAETIRKATQPFFSGQAAGRKRGMGLTHAQRLVKRNNGLLSITSGPATGTTVTILLPCK
ncbi:MAG: HDOD domain-containing protein [Planctomycetota bacterium]|jgi:putative nucleotidyltransferase with HDIG domain